MALLPIRTYPDPILRVKCGDLTAIDAETEKLIDDMTETMYDAEGIGLAAPQVGIEKRIAVIDTRSEEKNSLLVFINPIITWRDGDVSSEEGCLSIPDYRDTIQRSEKVRVKAQRRDGEEFELEAEGLLAICLQHEIDHLDGVLFIDHLSRLKRELFKKWLKKRSRVE